MVVEYVKENIQSRPPVPAWVIVLCVGAAASALYVATLVDRALPAPLMRKDAPADRFIAENAYDHLVNLTNIGPRVAGTYENEVAAVAVLVAAAKQIAREASPHNVVDIDVQRASGAFSLSFFDGMNNIYSDVQNVVVRARSVGGLPGRRTALLLNCHYDTVPDSPGASDDAAGCAVGLETLRALVAAPRPLRHDVILLLNGAEENIMQASHAFITHHKWAKSVRAFINIEACGAGGREVMFQAGPRDPWIVEVYARAVPHPFASSLAQEMFQSGIIPADTDFRIFRDFGQLSGVDLAWSSDGYVYHTRLDDAARVPLPVLQRTGDNVLALATGLLGSLSLESAARAEEGQPVFWDLLGVLLVVARPTAAVLLALLTLGLVLLRLHLAAGAANKRLYMSRAAWLRAVLQAGVRVVGAGLAGAGAAAGIGAGLQAGGAPLPYYARPALLAPLVALPALSVAAPVMCAGRGIGALPPGARRGWWAARAASDALAAGGAACLAACLVLRVRSGYLPLLWTLLPTLADLAATAFKASDRGRAWWWAAGWTLPVLQSAYVARDSMAMLLPLCGRAGAPKVPVAVVMAAAVAVVVLLVCNWVAALAVASRDLHYIAWAGLACGAACAAWAVWWGAEGSYTPARPQRLMMFHVRRVEHVPGRPDLTTHYYWLPELDPNTEARVRTLGREWRRGDADSAEWVYGGAPYSLPVYGLVPRWLQLEASGDEPAPDHAAVALNYTARLLEPGLYALRLYTAGPSHMVVIVSPGAGGTVEYYDALHAAPVEAAAWGRRRTYFLATYAAPARSAVRRMELRLRLPVKDGAGDEGGWSSEEWAELCQLSVAGHALGGPRGPAHQQVFRDLPPNVAPTGWPVHLHLYRLLRPH